MAARCGQCGHLNNKLGSTRFCDVCGAPLPRSLPMEDQQATRAPKAAPSPHIPHSAPVAEPPTLPEPRVDDVPATPARDAGSRVSLTSTSPVVRPSAAWPDVRRASSVPEHVRPTLAEAARPLRRVGTASVATPRNVLEGTVIRVDPLDSEPADPDIARLLASIVVVVDLVVLLGSLALALVAVTIAVTVVAAVLNLPWLSQIVGSVVQLFLYILTPLLQRLPGFRGEQQMEPVTNYLLRAADNAHYTFRIKGRLRGATVSARDRVRVWGRPQHGILRFRGGLKLDTGESLTLPTNLSWLLLGFLVVANIVLYVYLQGRLPF